MSKCYLWDEKKKEVIVTERLYHEDVRKYGYYDMLCVDEEIHSTAPLRYGKFTRLHGWAHVPLCNFPAEFRTWLLIMGVP